MRVAMTLVVRDEVDLVDDWLRYHLACGVDQVIVTDHRSVDGTSDVLAEHARDGRVQVIREDAHEMRQADWVTRMARLAATEHGADWVVNSDADEFWWPRDGGIHELLDEVPRRFGVVRALWRQFVLRPDGPEPFAERMIVRCRPVADFSSPYHAQVKIAHRALPGRRRQRRQPRRVRRRADARPRVAPVRSAALPAPHRGAARGQVPPPAHDPRWRPHRGGDPAARLEGLSAYHDAVLFDDEDVGRGLGDGTLVEDTRLRDALAVARRRRDEAARGVADTRRRRRPRARLPARARAGQLGRTSTSARLPLERSVARLEGAATLVGAGGSSDTRGSAPRRQPIPSSVDRRDLECSRRGR